MARKTKVPKKKTRTKQTIAKSKKPVTTRKKRTPKKVAKRSGEKISGRLFDRESRSKECRKKYFDFAGETSTASNRCRRPAG